MLGNPAFFLGRVVNREDPTKTGGLQIRAYGFHDDETNIPDADLPWAKTMMPPTSSSLGQIGSSPTGIQANSTVVGIYLDADHQNLLVLGTLHGANASGQSSSGGTSGSSGSGTTEREHDVAINARGEGDDVFKTAIDPKKEPDEFEPTTAASPVYPYNKVTKTEGGHVTEVDDTPGKERLRFMHKDGSYFEYTNGRLVSKVTGSSFTVVQQGSTMLVKGDVKMQVNGNVTANVGGDMTQTVKGTTTLKSTGPMNIESPAGINVKTAGTLAMNAGAIEMTKSGGAPPGDDGGGGLV